MTRPLHWYQRLSWRAFLTFLVALIIVEIPLWLLVDAAPPVDPDRAAARALGTATSGAIIAAALAALVWGAYLRRRMSAAQRVVEGAVAGDLRMTRVRDEVHDLAEEVGESIATMRATMIRLRQETGRLSALLEGMGEAVLMIDDAERLVLANPVAEKLLGLPDDYVGRRLAEVCDASDVVHAAADVLWSKEPMTEEVDFPYKSDVRHLSVSISPILTGESAMGAVVVLHDVTRLRRLERVRRDFVANVSHELRTPIAAVRSAAETLTLAEPDIDPELLDFLETIERNAVRMGSIVEDLLTLSRLEAAGEEFDLHEVSLSPVFADVVDRAAPLAREAGVDFDVDAEEELPNVFGEAGALRQILQNVVENAIKYTPRGGAVRLVARRKGRKRVKIEVNDTGIGIPSRHLPRIFERFYRVDVGRSREIGGTGLGLAIVKHLVRKLRGRISVESTEGEGTTVTLWFRSYRPEKAQ